VLPSGTRTRIRRLAASAVLSLCIAHPSPALGWRWDTPGGEDPAAGTPVEPKRAEPHPRSLWAALISVGVVGGAALNSFTDHPTGGFHLAHEGWFGEHTYVGGADKASHFVSFEIVARELATTYQYLGYSPQQSRLGGFIVSVLAGSVIEIADGTNEYGFAYEDLLMDLLGASTAVVLSTIDAYDLVGFRAGRMPGPAPPRETDGLGRDYSHEIYTADLKLAGLSQRLGINFGPARFLLASLTYGVKGYPYGAPDQRERQLGFELGLNFGEMLHAVNVHQDTWWGIASHAVFDNFRIPYTAGGFRYDLNHHRWHGPDTGDSCGGCN
jgi:uncharacterized protein YfiM (DUF2279 family)